MNHPFENAKWIAASEDDCQSPIIQREFTLDSVSNAMLYITGLGYFEARINDQPITEDLLIPVASDYERRDTFHTFYYPVHDTFTHRTYYCRYDVTHLLKKGSNTLRIQLGNGWYRQMERVAEGDTYYSSKLKAVYCLNISGLKSIVSDGSEQWYCSEITENQLFIGEIHDARISEQAPDMHPVVVVPNPNTILTEETAPADRVIRTLNPICLFRDGERSLWDAGENISGVVRVSACGKRGEEIRLRFAEKVKDQHLDFASACGAEYVCRSGRNQIMEDVFICGNQPRQFTPKFVWHAFRFFEITGPACDPEVLVIHSNTPVDSAFESDSEGWNFLYDAFLRTQLDNMHGSFPSDCPHRERLGYTGDGQAASAPAMLLLNSQQFYQKWIQDILDCQDPNTGHVQHTAPFMGGGGGPGGWGCAIAIVPWNYYQIFGDVTILAKCYPAIRKWIGYLRSRCENNLLVREEDGGWCLGEWCTPEKNELPNPFVNTCFFIHTLTLAARMAMLLKRPAEETQQYSLWIDAMRSALKENYYHPESHSYCGNKQGAHAYAAWVGLADPSMLEAMADHYRRTRRFDTGFLGTAILCDVLFSNGYADVVHGIMENDCMGTFLYMKRNGATTIWERWNGGSNNHPMFGGCTASIVNHLLGIRPANDMSTYQNLTIAPVLPSKMNYASGSITTPWGIITSAWEKAGTQTVFRISIPDNVNAVFRYGMQEEPLPPGTHQLTFPFIPQAHSTYTYHGNKNTEVSYEKSIVDR